LPTRIGDFEEYLKKHFEVLLNPAAMSTTEDAESEDSGPRQRLLKLPGGKALGV